MLLENFEIDLLKIAIDDLGLDYRLIEGDYKMMIRNGRLRREDEYSPKNQVD